jgi:hypothetical protein
MEGNEAFNPANARTSGARQPHFKENFMLQSVEAIVEPSGTVRLLEALYVDQPRRAVVTLLESPVSTGQGQACADDILHFLERTRLSPGARLSSMEIDAQVEEERNAW